MKPVRASPRNSFNRVRSTSSTRASVKTSAADALSIRPIEKTAMSRMRITLFMQRRDYFHLDTFGITSSTKKWTGPPGLRAGLEGEPSVMTLKGTLLLTALGCFGAIALLGQAPAPAPGAAAAPQQGPGV